MMWRAIGIICHTDELKGFHNLGIKFRAWLDFGAGWLESRAAYLNEGA